jgi:hypothetical protein
MFVWSDGNGHNFDPVAYRSAGQSVNTFNVRATGIGGAFFTLGVNASGLPTWICYAQNGGGWTCTSDRNAKRNLRPVNAKAVLEKLVAMPVYQWQPKDGVNREVEHMGPMAQDFMAAFALGDNDKAIGSQDADGVALAAIQGLHQIVQEKDREIVDLRDRMTQMESLRGELAALKQQLTELMHERAVTATRGR